MCLLRHRYPISEFTMGPLPEPSLKDLLRVSDSILADFHELTEEQKESIRKFGEERQKQLDTEPHRGLRPPLSVGWKCPNCGGAHSPDVPSCPEPPRGGSLRERLKSARE